ncbi:MAG: hypothetical protein ACE5QW_00415 [Thermoplasmata archaeon]
MKKVSLEGSEQAVERLHRWLGMTEETGFRMLLLYLPLVCVLPGWIVIIFTSDVFPKPTFVLGMIAFAGYLPLAVVQAKWLKTKALSECSQSFQPWTFFVTVFSISCLGVGILWSIPFGVGVLNAILIYAGTIFFGIIHYASTFLAFRAVPRWRTLTLRSIALFSTLAVIFLISFLYFTGAVG